MKKSNIFAISRMGIICLFAVLIVGSYVAFTDVFKEETYRSDINESSVYLSGHTDAQEWKMKVNSFTSQASFIVENQELQEVVDLHFKLPTDLVKTENSQLEAAILEVLSFNNCNEISFDQRNQMVLPLMKMIHLVGNLNIANRSIPVSLPVGYVINSDQSISLKGTKSIKFNEYGINVPSHLLDAVSADHEILIDFNLVLRKERVTLSE